MAPGIRSGVRKKMRWKVNDYFYTTVVLKKLLPDLKSSNLTEPFTVEGSSPSPSKRGWGEVTQAQQDFHALNRTP